MSWLDTSWPVHALADAVTLTLTGARLQIGVSAGRNVSEAIGVQAGASLGAVLIHYRPQVTGDVSRSLHAESSEMELRPIASVFVAAAARLGPVELGLVPQMDLQLTRTSYEVSQDGTLVPLFKPWILQPGLALLVGWNISAPRSYQSNPQRIAASAKPPPR